MNGKEYGGYAGLSVRAARELRNDKEWQFINHNGSSVKHGKKAQYVSFMGPNASITIVPGSSHEYCWYITKGMPVTFEKSLKLVKGASKKVSYRIKIEGTRSK